MTQIKTFQLAFRIAHRNRERGTSLIEAMVAIAMLLIVGAGLMGLFVFGISTTENQGHLQARATEYAQDKMEQLQQLPFTDVHTDTSVFPVASQSTGNYGLTNGGGYDPANPVTPYVDYVDAQGNSTVAANYYFIRVWKIENATDSAGNTIANLKKITVTSRARSAIGRQTLIPQTTIASYKSDVN